MRSTSEGEGASPSRSVAETRTGKFYAVNYDRFVADDGTPLFAVIDSECDDGTSGDLSKQALLDARPELARAIAAGPDAAERVMTTAIQRANAAILQDATAGGASVTACTWADGVVVVAHVGECRLYALEAGWWLRKTHDHTLAEELRESAHSSQPPSELRLQGRVITRAVGVAESVAVATYRFARLPSTTVLLCTPGAWLPVDPEMTGEPLDAAEIGERPVEHVLRVYEQSGQRDNATIVLACFDDGGPGRGSEARRP